MSDTNETSESAVLIIDRPHATSCELSRTRASFKDLIATRNLLVIFKVYLA